jgi:hypothetical protein
MSETLQCQLDKLKGPDPFKFVCESDPKTFAVEVSGHRRCGYTYRGHVFLDHQGRYCQAMILLAEDTLHASTV